MVNNFFKKSLKVIVFIFLVILILVGVLVAYKNSSNKVGNVVIELYGTSTDPAMVGLESILLQSQKDFNKKVKVNFNYVVDKLEDGTFVSFQSYKKDSNELLNEYDVAENKRRLVMQEIYPVKFLHYLQLRTMANMDVDWKKFAVIADMDTKEIEEKVEEKGLELLGQVFDKAQEIRTTHNVNILPIVLINNKFYNTTSDFLSVYTDIVKDLLRKGETDLSKIDNKVEVFGGLITINKGANNLSINGVTECYDDSHCDDKIELDGVCENKGTLKARCSYNNPAIINMLIVTNQEEYESSNDVVVKGFKYDNKGVKVTNIVKRDDEEVIKFLGPIQENESEIYYIFDDTIKSSKFFKFYEDNNIIVNDNGIYMINNDLRSN